MQQQSNASDELDANQRLSPICPEPAVSGDGNGLDPGLVIVDCPE